MTHAKDTRPSKDGRELLERGYSQPQKKSGQGDHWAGWLDLVGHAVKETAPRIQRAHLQIADSVFARVNRVPAAQPAVVITRALHHLIADIAYTSVTYSGAGLSQLARLRFTPLEDSARIGIELHPQRQSSDAGKS